MALGSRNLQLMPRILSVGPRALRELRLERQLDQIAAPLKKYFTLVELVQKNSSKVEPPICKATQFLKKELWL